MDEQQFEQTFFTLAMRFILPSSARKYPYSLFMMYTYMFVICKDVFVLLLNSSMLFALLSWARGYKTYFMLNSIGHEILNARKYKNIKKFGFL